MREEKDWVVNRIPFAAEENEPQYVLHLHYNNTIVKGVHGKWGIRLFHYTNQLPFQDLEMIHRTAECIANEVNEDCVATLLYDRNRLFQFDRPCVWNNITQKNDCLQKLKRETCCELNDSLNSYPAFWDEHYKIISKYFYPKKLTIELANLFNAPIECIDPAIERSEDLMLMIELRRNYTDQFIISNLRNVCYRNPELDTFDETQTKNTETEVNENHEVNVNCKDTGVNQSQLEDETRG
jgi:hypothetical protein